MANFGHFLTFSENFFQTAQNFETLIGDPSKHKVGIYGNPFIGSESIES